MIRLSDGPCRGSYLVKRAPLYLRAVRGASGNTDVLDQLDDEASSSERIYVYQRQGEPMQVHLNLGRKGSGFYSMADYRHIADVDGEPFRDAASWRVWATEQRKASV